MGGADQAGSEGTRPPVSFAGLEPGPKPPLVEEPEAVAEPVAANGTATTQVAAFEYRPVVGDATALTPEPADEPEPPVAEEVVERVEVGEVKADLGEEDAGVVGPPVVTPLESPVATTDEPSLAPEAEPKPADRDDSAADVTDEPAAPPEEPAPEPPEEMTSLDEEVASEPPEAEAPLPEPASATSEIDVEALEYTPSLGQRVIQGLARFLGGRRNNNVPESPAELTEKERTYIEQQIRRAMETGEIGQVPRLALTSGEADRSQDLWSKYEQEILAAGQAIIDGFENPLQATASIHLATIEDYIDARANQLFAQIIAGLTQELSTKPELPPKPRSDGRPEAIFARDTYKQLATESLAYLRQRADYIKQTVMEKMYVSTTRTEMFANLVKIANLIEGVDIIREDDKVRIAEGEPAPEKFRIFVTDSGFRKLEQLTSESRHFKLDVPSSQDKKRAYSLLNALFFLSGDPKQVGRILYEENGGFVLAFFYAGLRPVLDPKTGEAIDIEHRWEVEARHITDGNMLTVDREIQETLVEQENQDLVDDEEEVFDDEVTDSGKEVYTSPLEMTYLVPDALEVAYEKGYAMAQERKDEALKRASKRQTNVAERAKKRSATRSGQFALDVLKGVDLPDEVKFPLEPQTPRKAVSSGEPQGESDRDNDSGTEE